MKLGTKILLGFSSLIVIAVLLGSLAVYKMSAVKRNATTLAGDYMPATAVANGVERESLLTMYEMRGYALTEDTNYLTLAEQNLADVQKHLQDAADLASKSDEHLGFLKEAAEKAAARTREYEGLAKKTVTVIEALEKDRAAMNTIAQEYMKACSDFLESQNTTLQEMLKSTNSATGLNAAAIQDRILKMNLVNQVVDLGNAIRVGNFKAQATRNPALFRETENLFAQVYQKLDTLVPMTKQEVNLKQIELCRAASQGYERAMANFLTNWLAREELSKQRGVAADAVLTEAKNTAATSMDTSIRTSTTAAMSLATASLTVIVGLGVATLIGVVLSYLITGSITKPVRAVANQISAGADQTAGASGQVSSSSQSLAEGASEQAASLEETSSALEELSSMTQRNSENAHKANELAKQARSAAERGTTDMEAMSRAMDAIKASSDDIAKIIKTIDEIAFQTNILALNAAVEAARAGEAGMGFAVVADEVRSLAHRSAQAAKETSGKIESAIKNTAQGVELSTTVAVTLKDIVAKAREVDELVAEVAGASREQNQGIAQINTTVSQMDKVTQSNAASAEEGAAAAEELNAQAQSMKDAVKELLRLVDGQNGLGQRPAATRAAKPKTGVKPVFAKPETHAAAPANGNGHGRMEIPMRQTKSDRAVTSLRCGIPTNGEFRDF